MPTDHAVASLAHLFATQVRARPDVVAVRHHGTDLTYAELDRWSTDLARRLRTAGTRPGDLVAVAVDRSPATVAAILAVIKTGAGYLALDPDTPVRRHRVMALLAKPTAMLARPHLDRLPTLDVPRVFLGEPSTDEVPSVDWEVPGTDDTVFHVVPTSGTTGTPRLVRIGYGAVLNRLMWMWRDHPFGPGAVVAVQKSPALVASPWELLGGLLRGVRSVVLSQDEVLDPALFVDVIVKEGISHLYLTPHLINGLIEEADRAGGLSHRMRMVTSGADVLTPALVRRFHRTFPGVTLLNLYGMTETASNIASYDTAALPADATRVPVGRPVANAKITVRDGMLRLVPIGVTGELCVAGPPVALGYLGDDEQTAFRFVSRQGEILFRTGDRGRWLADGTLELTGRADNQVKIRGYRVELEEVETALAVAPGVSEACVCVLPSPGGTTLVGCVVADEPVDVPAVRAHLRDRLPDYMVPARVVQVPALARGANGKVDRVAVTAQVERMVQRASPPAEYTPADAQEELVVRCWIDVLGAAPETAKQNFFDAGGHSLLAVRLTNRLRAATTAQVSLREVLENPTVAGIAALLDGRPRT